MIYVMLKNRSFFLVSGRDRSNLEFQVEEGLQHGTVNAPLLFSIYTSHILNLCGLNTGNGTFSIAFADDLVLYIANKSKKKAQELL